MDMLVCPKCGYDRNPDDALYCNLCHENFKKKKITSDKDSSKEITSFDDLPAELKATLLKEKDELLYKQEPIIDPKKIMMWIGIFVLLLVLIGGLFVILPLMSSFQELPETLN
jgi:uncharacterized membrane protein YvbJ